MKYLIFMLVLFFQACDQRSLHEEERWRLLVEKSLSAELRVGDETARIEAALKRRGMPFSYDLHNQCYSAKFEVMSSVARREIRIYVRIYIVEGKGFQRVEARVAHPFL